jgi:hypothetical protein
MSAAVVDRIARRRKSRVGEGAHGDAHSRLFVPFLGVEHGRPADRAEPEREPGSLITDAHVLGCTAGGLVGGGKAGQRRKDTSGATLTGEAVANADSEWLPLDVNA